MVVQEGWREQWVLCVCWGTGVARNEMEEVGVDLVVKVRLWQWGATEGLSRQKPSQLVTGFHQCIL